MKKVEIILPDNEGNFNYATCGFLKADDLDLLQHSPVLATHPFKVRDDVFSYPINSGEQLVALLIVQLDPLQIEPSSALLKWWL